MVILFIYGYGLHEPEWTKMKFGRQVLMYTLITNAVDVRSVFPENCWRGDVTVPTLR
jgi:hypothetical protein